MPPTRGEGEAWFAEKIMEAARSLGRSQEGLDFMDLDGGSPDFQGQALDGFLAAPSLFSSGRALLLGRAEKAVKVWPKLRQSLEEAVRRPDGPAWMVVQIGGQAPLPAAFKGLKAGKKVRLARFRRLYGDPPPWRPDPDASEAAQFARGQARERGLLLDPGVPGLLVQMAGPRPGQLCQALDHLALVSGEQVSEEEVRAVVAHSAEGNAFDFAHAVLCGDGPGALQRLKSMDRVGLRSWDGRRLGAPEAFSLLLSVLAGERRKTAHLRQVLDQGISWDEACGQAGLKSSGPPAQRMKARLQARNGEQLAALAEFLRDAERQVKMLGWRDPRRALEWMVFRAHRSRRRT